MKSRVIKKKDYWRLLGTDLEKVIPGLPKGSKIVISEENGNIIGHWALIPYYHVECFGVGILHRKKAGVAKGLFRTMFDLIRRKKIKSVLTAAITEEVEKYIIRLGGVELPGKHYVLGIAEKEN